MSFLLIAYHFNQGNVISYSMPTNAFDDALLEAAPDYSSCLTQ